MGYFMRYFTKEVDLDFDWIASTLHGEALRWEEDTLLAKDQPIAVISVERSNEELFQEEVEELLEFLADGEGDVKRVKNHLKASKTLVCVQVLQGGDVDPFPILDNLWIALFDHYPGLLQADGEGWYDGRTLICSVE